MKRQDIDLIVTPDSETDEYDTERASEAFAKHFGFRPRCVSRVHDSEVGSYIGGRNYLRYMPGDNVSSVDRERSLVIVDSDLPGESWQ